MKQCKEKHSYVSETNDSTALLATAEPGRCLVTSVGSAYKSAGAGAPASQL